MSLFSLAWDFLWISTVTLGGGMAMLPLMERAFVTRRKWLTPREMVDVVAIMQSLPGLIAVNMAVLVGYRVKGVIGALVAVAASVVSPFLIIVLLATGLSTVASDPLVGHVFLGVRAGTAALILLSLADLARMILVGRLAWTLSAIAFVAAAVFRVDTTYVVIGGFAVGIGLMVFRALGRMPR